MTPRVLSAAAKVWVEGSVPSGLEEPLRRGIAEALVGAKTTLVLDGEKRRLAVAACGDHYRIRDDANPFSEGEEVFSVSALVTTARTPGVEGHLMRKCGDEDPRRWVFVAGVDPYAFCAQWTTLCDPYVEEAVLVPTAAAEKRAVRKSILGYK